MYRRRRKIDTMWLKRNDAKRFICMIITIVISVYPMSLSPVWNGTIPGHRDQYDPRWRRIACSSVAVGYSLSAQTLRNVFPQI